jgi:hypothetical protein
MSIIENFKDISNDKSKWDEFVKRKDFHLILASVVSSINNLHDINIWK